MTIVVDASVVVAALLDTGAVGTWAEQVLTAGPLAAPHLMPLEVANVLRRSALSDDITADTAALAHEDLLALRVELFPYGACADRAWELRPNVTLYDGWYIALAESLGADLATLTLVCAEPVARVASSSYRRDEHRTRRWTTTCVRTSSRRCSTTSLEAVVAELEAVDVRNGEYAFFAADGRVIQAVVTGDAAGDFELHLSQADAAHRLQQRLEAALPGVGIDAALARSPLAAAQALIDGRWAVRWPRQPAWLDRRLHGVRPVVDQG